MCVCARTRAIRCFAWFLVIPLKVILVGFLCSYNTCWGWVNSLSVDIICSHIILSNKNQKQPERFPEEQLAHANVRLLILIWVVMTFLQLPHFLTLLLPHCLEDRDFFFLFEEPRENPWASLDVILLSNAAHRQNVSFETITYKEYNRTNLPVKHSLGLFLCQGAIHGWFFHFTSRGKKLISDKCGGCRAHLAKRNNISIHVKPRGWHGHRLMYVL